MTSQELVTLVSAPLLFEASIDRQERRLLYTAKDSPDYAVQEGELESLRARWAAEAPSREARAILKKKGFVESRYGSGFVRKNRITQRWDKFTVEQACEEAIKADGIK